MELVGIGGYITRLQAIVFKALIPAVPSPDKNEHYADYEKYIRQIGLFKGEFEHFYISI